VRWAGKKISRKGGRWLLRIVEWEWVGACVPWSWDEVLGIESSVKQGEGVIKK
jgi:hypothetical protein